MINWELFLENNNNKKFKNQEIDKNKTKQTHKYLNESLKCEKKGKKVNIKFKKYSFKASWLFVIFLFS